MSEQCWGGRGPPTGHTAHQKKQRFIVEGRQVLTQPAVCHTERLEFQYVF